MIKIIILCFFIVFGILFVNFNLKKEPIYIKKWISKNQNNVLSSESIINSNIKVIRFEDSDARISLSPSSKLIFQNLELTSGSMRIQSLWIKKQLQINIHDLKVKLTFGDFFVKRINKNQFLFLTIRGNAQFYYNNFSYNLKENNFFIYEINESSLNLIRLFYSKIKSTELNTVLRQNRSEYIDFDFSDQLLDLNIRNIKFQD